MACVEYKNINNIFNELPYNQAISASNQLTNQLYAANKDNLELINRLNGIINNLKNEVKSLKNNEKIVEVWKGNKIITYDRIKNKVTWRYWWVDLPSDLIENLIEEGIKYYYQNFVLQSSPCSLDTFEIYQYKTSHMYNRLLEKKYTNRRCEGYNNNGKPCKYYGHYSSWYYEKDEEKSKMLKFSKTDYYKNSYYKPYLCKKCCNKYRKRGNLYDEWFKDAGYGERNGYCIRIK